MGSLAHEVDVHWPEGLSPDEAHDCIQIRDWCPGIFTAKGRSGNTLIPILSFHQKIAFTFYDNIPIDFLSPWRCPSLPKESDGPTGHIPTWFSRKFHRRALTRHILSRSGNWQAQNVVQLPFSICKSRGPYSWKNLCHLAVRKLTCYLHWGTLQP